LVAVKYLQLNEALADIKYQVGPDTLILSLLNGITSEGIIAQSYGMDKVVYCVAQGMDAVKVGNRLTYKNMGRLCIGPPDGGPLPEKVQRVESFFRRMDLPHEVDEHMQKRMWGKFMLNVGVNQTVAVFGPCYLDVQKEGMQRDTMTSAMREVIALSELEGVNLTQEDLQYWLRLLGTLDPSGKPSMRQDVEAKRPSEVALFSGAVLDLAKKHGLDVPVNQMLYENILAMESRYQ
jgi:2-dehydropantoate 2-reductase